MQVWTAVVPRRLRRRFLVKPVAKWLVPALRCMAGQIAFHDNPQAPPEDLPTRAQPASLWKAVRMTPSPRPPDRALSRG